MIKPLGSIEFERISIEDANEAIDRRVRPATVKDWGGERGPTPAEPLSAATVAWLGSLPFELRPRVLARQYPRIANRLCELWKRPSHCDAYFKKLIMDERGGRKGFPQEVAAELSALAGHYSSVYPYRQSIWDDVLRK